MNHTDAVRIGAVERYQLGQLTASESQEFEEHFFDCSECTRELHTGALFEENARAVFADEELAGRSALAKTRSLTTPKPSMWARFWQSPWIAAPAMAAIVLALVMGYQAVVVIPGLHRQLSAALAPQAVASFVLPPISRGEAHALEIPVSSQFFAIYMDPTWEGSYAAYLCSVQDESGTARFSVKLPAPGPGKPIQVLMARSTLPSGRYTVVIRNAAETGKPESELARYSLILKLD